MKKLFSTTIRLAMLLLIMAVAQSCCIHLWPEKEIEQPGTPKRSLSLHLRFHPDMYIWEHLYDAENLQVVQRFPNEAVAPDQPGTTDIYDNTILSGIIRHIVRIYPAGDQVNYIEEIVVSNIIDANGYDQSIRLELPEGNYDIAVWSDPVENNDDFFHDPSDFFSVNLKENKRANSDSQDAFRGIAQIIVEPVEEEQSFVVEMNRPYSKFEFIATDVADFITRETTRLTRGPVDLSEYKVVFTYSNFMPFSYSVIDDRLVDSKAGKSYETEITKISDSEVSLGFDYVMINAVANVGDSQAVQVIMTVYDPEGEQVANSAPIRVPLRRDNHTIIKSRFLSENSQGGVAIDPEYEGDHNIIM